jgi:hypothetical protein
MVQMVGEDILNTMLKTSYDTELDRLGFFCDTCGKETRNASGLVHFTSSESANALNVCHDCLPEDFE